MGLYCSHDTWGGTYSTFNRWRHKLAEVAGIPLPLMEGYYTDVGGMDDGWNFFGAHLPLPWELLRPDPIHILLNHSDCDGWIDYEDCGPLADRLEELLPLLPDEDGGGHIGNWRAVTRRFIRGLRLAATQKESVTFQ